MIIQPRWTQFKTGVWDWALSPQWGANVWSTHRRFLGVLKAFIGSLKINKINKKVRILFVIMPFLQILHFIYLCIYKH